MESSFRNVFAVDIDLSLAGFDHALEAWLKSDVDWAPDVIWISPADAIHAGSQFCKDLIEEHGIDFAKLWMISVAPEYKHGQWSIGTRDDRGFGSKGSVSHFGTGISDLQRSLDQQNGYHQLAAHRQMQQDLQSTMLQNQGLIQQSGILGQNAQNALAQKLRNLMGM